MKSPRNRRLADGRVPYLGLRAPDGPSDGVLVLDWNPRDDGRQWPSWLLIVLLCVPWCFTALATTPLFLHPSPEGLGLPALLAGMSLVLSYVVLLRVLSLERIRLVSSGLEYLRGDGLMRRRRAIPFAEIRRLTPYSVMVERGRKPSFHPEYGVAIETIGRPLCVGQSRDPDAADRLREDLESHLQDRYPAWINQPRPADCEFLDASGSRPEPPSDSTLSCRREWDRTEFLARIPVEPSGTRSVWLVVCLLLFGLSATLDEPGPLRTGLFGAGSLGMVLLSPLRRRWVVRPGEITTFVGVGKLGRSRTTDIEWLERMELRRLPSNTSWNSRFELALVDLDGDDKGAFGPLTEGEARWMAGIVAGILKDALPRTGQEIYRWSVKTEAPTAGSRAMADAWLDEGLAGPGIDKTPKTVE
jgi:hypothetical protein